MASTINATTNGIVTIGDSVATLSLQTGGTTAVAISTAQIVTLSKSLALLGSTSGSVTIAAPAVAGSTTLTLPATTGTLVVSGGDGAFTTLSASSTVSGTGFSTYLASPPAIGGTAAAAGTFTSGTFGSTVHKGSSSGTITIAAPATAGTQSYTLPTGVPAANGYALTSTTGGVMSWASVGGGGSSATPTTEGIVYGYTPNGSGTVALGYQASNNSFRPGCVAIGYAALASMTSGSDGYNTCVGANAGQSITTAAYSTLVGQSAGSSLTTGVSNTVVGNSANVSAAGAIGQMVFGQNLTGQADFTITIGGPGGSKIYNAYTVNATWATASDERLKKNINDDPLGLSFIKRLRPVTFTWKPSNEIDPSLPYYNETNQRNSTTVVHGLIAQEVKAALDAEGCTTFNGWDAGNDDTIQAVSREMFVSPLIKAIQELSAANQALTARVAALEAK